MSLIINGTSIYVPIINGKGVTEIYVNGDLVYTMYERTTSIGAYYGGYFYNDSNPITYNRCTRIDSDGVIVGSETNIGTARQAAGGAGVDTIGMYYGGLTVAVYKNNVTRVNSSGALAGSETTVGTARYAITGASLNSVGMYFGGDTSFSAETKIVTRINSSGAIIGTETSAGEAKTKGAGLGFDCLGLFWGGQSTTSSYTDSLFKIYEDGTMLGSISYLFNPDRTAAGAALSTIGIIYGGWNYRDSLRMVNPAGGLLASETSLSTEMAWAGSAAVDGIAVFYLDYNTGLAPINAVFRIDNTGTQVGSTTYLGTIKTQTPGAGI